MRPLLLLIPGMLNTARIWSRVTPHLQGSADVRIANVQTQASIDDMARDAWAQLADVPADQPLVLCGFSMGGYVALNMIAWCERPVRAVALLDTSGEPESEAGAATRLQTIAAMERDFEKAAGAVARFGVHAGRQADTAFMDDTIALLREVGAETAIRQTRAVMGRADHRSVLARLEISALVMCGEDDRITPPALSEKLAGQIPGARLEWITNAGHMTPLEQPARVAELIKTLL